MIRIKHGKVNTILCTNKKYCKSYLKYIKTKDKLLIFKCLKCNKSHKKYFNKDLVKRFANTYKFCDENINKLSLMLRKGVYPYECENSWQRFNETLLPEKEEFYRNFNIEDITDEDYKHAKKVW